MIKIYLSQSEKNQICELVWSDFDKNILKDIIILYNKLKNNGCDKIAELIYDKKDPQNMKTKNLMLLDGKQAMQSFISEFESTKEIIGEDHYSYALKLILNSFTSIFSKFSNRNVAYNLLEILKVNVCPYCNRMYTFTVKSGNKKTRPEFDHYFPKSIYPFLAISIYNLIPSCGICNKGKSDTLPKNILYPYEDSFEDMNIYFELQDTIKHILYKSTAHDSIVKLKSNSSQDIIDAYNNIFKIDYLYNQHRDYIIDIIRKKHIFNDDLINSLYYSYGEIFNNRQDIESLLFNTYNAENYSQRPLSKLTNDIIIQLTYF